MRLIHNKKLSRAYKYVHVCSTQDKNTLGAKLAFAIFSTISQEQILYILSPREMGNRKMLQPNLYVQNFRSLIAMNFRMPMLFKTSINMCPKYIFEKFIRYPFER